MPLHVSSTMCSSSGGQNCIIQHLVSSNVEAYNKQLVNNVPIFTHLAPIICFTGPIDTKLSDKYSIKILRMP